jgi:hypothetical protein
MPITTFRIAAIGATLAAIGTMAVAATPAAAAPLNCKEAQEAGSTAPICENFTEFEASGSILDKKLNQAIPLNKGLFNGYLELLSLAPITGQVHGLVTSQPQELEVKVFGTTAKIGVTFEQVGVTNGSLTQLSPEGNPNCERIPTEVCVNLSVPTEANIGFTSFTIFGLKFSLKCKTATPISFPLSDNLMLNEELLNFEVGSHFVGTTTFPAVKCNELFAFITEPLLTSEFSGPENSYSLFIRE